MEEQAILIELEPSGDGTCPAEPDRRRKAEGAPKIKRIDRDQSAFVSLCVENLVGADDKVRAIWELTGRMDLSRLYEPIVSRENEAGQAAEDPRLLVAIWVWCYSEGISSSRQVEHLIDPLDLRSPLGLPPLRLPRRARPLPARFQFDQYGLFFHI